MKRLSNIKSEMFKNGIERASATCALYLEELVGDCAQCGMLVSFYQHRLSQQTEKEMQLQQSQKSISTKRLQNLLMVDANDENFIAFRNIIDDMVKSAICQLYGRFSEYTQPIITQSMLRHMENAFRSLLPVQYHACRAMIGKQSVINIDSEETMNNDSSPLNIRLNQTWDRYILYLFIQQCRVRNSHYFSWFAVVNAAASYGANRLHIPVHFGFSVSFTSLCRKLNSLFTFQQVMQRTTESLNEYSNFAIAVFDNSQLNLPLKFQRYASCGNMSLATTRLFIRPTIPDYLDDIVEDINCITIEYLDQAIPSPYGMPKFENINKWSSASIENEKYMTFESSIDTTGVRVKAYFNLKQLLTNVIKFRKLIPYSSQKLFRYSIDEHNNSIVRIGLPEKLKENLQPTCPTDLVHKQCSWYHHLRKLQYKYTSIWRGNVPAVQMLIPPVSPENETTNIGAANVIMSLLLLHGVIVASTRDGTDGDVKCLNLARDYQKRFIMVVGGGLSQLRVKTFENIIEQSSYKCNKTFFARKMIKAALCQVIHIPGDLHGGRFHFLSAIYSLFYGSLIQYIQILLGWKKIRGSDITQCYQQAAGLVTMITDELEKHLMGAFIHETHFRNDQTLNSIKVEKDGREVAILIATQYHQWLLYKQQNSDDEVFRMCINFVLLVNTYREFRIALNTGDSVMIECLYNDFLPIFYLTRKKHYIEIVLSMMDTLYSKVGYKHLQLIRINRTVPLYSGTDTQGIPMANWSLDGIVELIQQYYHKIRFKNDGGWSIHSPHVMMTSKSSRFVETEYNRTNDKAALEANATKVDNTTAVKCRMLEHLAIANYLQKLEVATETPGRRYNKETFLSALESVEVQLNEEGEEERAQRRIDEARTEDEGAMANLLDGLFNSNTEGNDDGNTMSNQHTEINFEQLVDEGTETDLEDEDNNDPSKSVAEKEIIVGTTKRKISTKIAAMNDSCLIDIRKEGRNIMKKANPKLTRYKKKQRNDRMSKFFDSVHEDIFQSNKSDMVLRAFDRFINKPENLCIETDNMGAK